MQIDCIGTKFDSIIYLSSDIDNVLKEQKSKRTLISNEYIDFLRDKIQKFYKDHILRCEFYSNSRNKFTNRNSITEQDTKTTVEDIHRNIKQTICTHNKWLIDYVKNMPFFKSLNDVDFATITYFGQFIVFALKAAQFKSNEKCYSIIANDMWFSRERMNMFLGELSSNMLMSLHQSINKLNLTERETALLYLFILTQCDGLILFHFIPTYVELKF